jgi:hypothetical protein
MSEIFQGATTEKLRNLAAAHNHDRAKVYAAMKQDLHLLQADAQQQDQRSGARNENSFSSSLTTNFLILGATTVASPKFAPIKAFSRDTSVDPYKPLATGQMKFNTTTQNGSTTQVNATNFESGDSTVTNVAVTVSQYTESFHITNSQLNSGLRMEDLITAKMASLGSKITQAAMTNVTAANFSTLTPLIRSYGAFNFSDTQGILAAIQKASVKNIILNGGYFYKLTNVPSLFQATPVFPGAGFKNLVGFDFVGLNTEWSLAGNNINGFACAPEALGVIAGLPLLDAPGTNGILGTATGILPGCECPIAVYTWFNTATRTYWGSFDMMFGAAPLDTTVGQVIATGTPS